MIANCNVLFPECELFNIIFKMKWLFLLIIFINASFALSQPKFIQGIFLDESDSIGVSDVHIFGSEGKLVSVADYYGHFSLPHFENQTYSATCIGYKTNFFQISSVVQDIVLLMSRDTVRLENITITPLTANDLILKVIENIESHYLKGGISEIGDLKFTLYKENELIFKYKKDGLKLELEPPDYYPEYLHELNGLEIKNVDTITAILFNEFEEDINGIFMFDHILHKRGFLNPENIDMWHYSIDGYTVYNDKNVIILSAKFIDPSVRTEHTSKIFISEDDYGILKLDFKYWWKSRNCIKTQIDSIWVDDFSWQGRANYIKVNDKYSLSYLDYLNKKSIYTRTLMHNFNKLFDYEITSEFNSTQR